MFQVESLNNHSKPDFTLPTAPGWLGKFKMKHLIIIIVVLAAVVTVGFLLLRHNNFDQNSVELKIDGPQEIAAGELAEYKVAYQNHNQVALTNAKLTFYYPEGSVAIRDNNVVATSNSSIDLGTIAPDASGEIVFQAYLVGDSGNVKLSRASLVFSVPNINSQFQSDADFSTTISSLSVALTLAAPPNIQTGQNLSYTLDYRNDSDEDKINLRLKLQYPDGFHFTSASPRPDAGSDTWLIPFLKAGNSQRITVNGSLTGRQGESKKISALLQRQITTESGDQYIDYEKTDATTTIASPPLSVQLLLNNSQDYVAHLADRLEYSATVKNNSSFDLLNITLSAQLSGTMYDYSTVQASGFFDSRTKLINWDSSTVSELADLKPGQSVKIPFSAQLKTSFSGGFGTKDAFVKASVHLVTESVPADLSQNELTADDNIVTRISTAPTFDQKLVISDASLGSGGPLPLQVDHKTIVFVHWTLVNPTNDVSGAKVSAVLAPGVVWENHSRVSGSQTQLSYNSKTNTVTWNLGTLPGGVGLAFPKYEAFFAISLTPSVNQIGQSPALLNNPSFSGTDSFTKEKILLNIRNMTSYDISDSDAEKTVQP